jgi:hypothetical protein
MSNAISNTPVEDAIREKVIELDVSPPKDIQFGVQFKALTPPSTFSLVNFQLLSLYSDNPERFASPCAS